MNILLLGGSNAGLRDGWAAHFQRLASEHHVQNSFLGAVGSLFGLVRLLKMRQERAPLPDLIIYEYTLNDILLFNAGSLRAEILADTLHAVTNFCAQSNIRLLFLCLEPLYASRPSVVGGASRVRRRYARVAKTHAMTPCIWLCDALDAEATSDSYRDSNHLAVDVSECVAAFVLAIVRDRPIAVPRSRGRADGAFVYIDATQARVEGPCRLKSIQSPVFEGSFLEISRSGSSVWPGRGELVGLMLRSLATSGAYMIRAGGRAYRKNAHSQMLETVRKLMLLHYSVRRLRVDGDLEISMPARESWLMNFPEDWTLLDSPSTTGFDDQVLEIGGVVLWRGATLSTIVQKLADFFPWPADDYR
jgi:hypothetical protein